MKRVVAFASAGILATCGLIEAQQNSSAGGVKTTAIWSGTQQVSVTDPVYRMTAYTLSMPTGWHFGGDVMRAQGCHGGGLSLSYKMESQDGLTAVIQLPGVKWHWDNDYWKDDHHMRQCEAVEIASAPDFVINVLLPEVRPKAKIVAVVAPSAEVQRMLEQQEQEAMQRYTYWAQLYGGQPPQHVYIDAIDVRLQYAIDGHPVEEMVTAIIDCYGGTTPSMGQRYPPVTNLFCSSRPERIVRAPQGQLDALLAAPEFKQLSKSVQPNQEWWNRYSADVNAQINRDRQLTSAVIAQSWVNFNAQQRASQAFFDQLSENSRVFNQNLQAQGERNYIEQQNRQAAQDAQAHRWINFAGDKADYTNPANGQTYVLSNKYSRTFFSSDGTTAIQTNGINPNNVPGSGVWNESQPH